MSETLIGRVEAVLISKDGSGISQQTKKIQLFSNRGVKHDIHYGSTRLLDIREKYY